MRGALSSFPQQHLHLDYKLQIFPCKAALYSIVCIYCVYILRISLGLSLKSQKIYKEIRNACIVCMQKVWFAEVQHADYIGLTKKGAKGFASQGQRTLFFKLSVKNQSRHFYHIKKSGAFNRYVTRKKAV